MAIKAKWALPTPTHQASWRRAFEQVSQLIQDGKIDSGKGFMLYLTDGKVSRTNSQNSYYWAAIVKTLSDATGIEGNDIHELFKSRFATYKMLPFVDGKRRKVRKSTTDMTKEEFSLYIEKCIAFCAEYGLVIPSPEKLSDGQMMELVADGILKG